MPQAVRLIWNACSRSNRVIIGWSIARNTSRKKKFIQPISLSFRQNQKRARFPKIAQFLPLVSWCDVTCNCRWVKESMSELPSIHPPKIRKSPLWCKVAHWQYAVQMDKLLVFATFACRDPITRFASYPGSSRRQQTQTLQKLKSKLYLKTKH